MVLRSSQATTQVRSSAASRPDSVQVGQGESAPAPSGRCPGAIEVADDAAPPAFALSLAPEARILEEVITRRDGDGTSYRLVELLGRLRGPQSYSTWRRYFLIPSVSLPHVMINSPSGGAGSIWSLAEQGRVRRLAFIILSAAGVEMLLAHRHPRYVTAVDPAEFSPSTWSSIPMSTRALPAPCSYRSFVETDTHPVVRGVGQYFSVYVARNGLQQVADLLRIGVDSDNALMTGIGIDVRRDWWSGSLTENYFGSIFYCRKLSSVQSCWGGQFLIAFDGMTPGPEVVGMGGALVVF